MRDEKEFTLVKAVLNERRKRVRERESGKVELFKVEQNIRRSKERGTDYKCKADDDDDIVDGQTSLTQLKEEGESGTNNYDRQRSVELCQKRVSVIGPKVVIEIIDDVNRYDAVSSITLWKTVAQTKGNGVKVDSDFDGKAMEKRLKATNEKPCNSNEKKRSSFRLT
jgi:hypothetical protein